MKKVASHHFRWNKLIKIKISITTFFINSLLLFRSFDLSKISVQKTTSFLLSTCAFLYDFKTQFDFEQFFDSLAEFSIGSFLFQSFFEYYIFLLLNWNNIKDEDMKHVASEVHSWNQTQLPPWQILLFKSYPFFRFDFNSKSFLSFASFALFFFSLMTNWMNDSLRFSKKHEKFLNRSLKRRYVVASFYSCIVWIVESETWSIFN